RIMRAKAKGIIGASDFIEVFVSTPLEICEQRDVKGLYAKARKGEITDFTGIQSPFEEPQHADLVLDTAKHSASESAARLLKHLEEINKKYGYE
ncbi:MAG TPA: adenylyl-sulfate kinase, partial [Bacteroidia bacterium]|nr:adenylyl-sulfate kinase [Bacteroidia bacterium]